MTDRKHEQIVPLHDEMWIRAAAGLRFGLSVLAGVFIAHVIARAGVSAPAGAWLAIAWSLGSAVLLSVVLSRYVRCWAGEQGLAVGGTTALWIPWHEISAAKVARRRFAVAPLTLEITVQGSHGTVASLLPWTREGWVNADDLPSQLRRLGAGSADHAATTQFGASGRSVVTRVRRTLLTVMESLAVALVVSVVIVSVLEVRGLSGTLLDGTTGFVCLAALAVLGLWSFSRRIAFDGPDGLETPGRRWYETVLRTRANAMQQREKRWFLWTLGSALPWVVWGTGARRFRFGAYRDVDG